MFDLKAFVKKAVEAFFGSYDNPFRAWMNIIAWCVLMYSLLSIAHTYQVGAELCVKYQPLVQQAEACVQSNNFSDQHPNVSFIPQVRCENLLLNPFAGNAYNWTRVLNKTRVN